MICDVLRFKKGCSFGDIGFIIWLNFYFGLWLCFCFNCIVMVEDVVDCRLIYGCGNIWILGVGIELLILKFLIGGL